MAPLSIIIFYSEQNDRIQFWYLEETFCAWVRHPTFLSQWLVASQSSLLFLHQPLVACIQSLIFRFFKISIYQI